MRVTLNRHCNNGISSFVAACMVELMLAYMWSVFGFSLKLGLTAKYVKFLYKDWQLEMEINYLIIVFTTIVNAFLED
jgi:hypothetical protein